MTEVPTLSEMRRALDEPAPPTLGEMAHANLLYQTDPDAYLEHYGIKGMKWGVRRSAAALGRLGKKASAPLKDEEGSVVGGIRARSRAGAQKLKDMKDGSTLILEDADGATKIMSKQKDGTFKEVYLSADAERVLRTSKKAESELSDAEITAAINRSKKIEEYNKLFNPQPNPNADLQNRVDAMKLEIALKQAQATLNPPKKKMVAKFVDTVSGGYGAYNRANKATNGLLENTMKQLYEDLKTKNSAASTASSTVGDAFVARSAAKKATKDAEDRFWSGGDNLRMPTATAATASNTRISDVRMSPTEQKRVDDYVHNITTMGQQDVNNPFYNSSPPITPLAYPELERRN